MTAPTKSKPTTKTTAKATAAASAPATPATYSDALNLVRDAKAVYDGVMNDANERKRKIRELNSNISTAARKEDFDKAAKLKAQRTALEAEGSAEKLAELRIAVNRAMRVATDMYFVDHPHALKSKVTVTRVVVVSPETQGSDEAIYLDSDTDVQLSLDNKHFDSEARHVEGWAYDNNFLVRSFTETIEV